MKPTALMPSPVATSPKNTVSQEDKTLMYYTYKQICRSIAINGIHHVQCTSTV